MFQDATSFNQSCDAWTVTNVTNMSNMFNGATTFNQSLNSWTTTSVTNMSNLFKGATSFNSQISGWNVSSVINMSGLFEGATSFNQSVFEWGDVSSTSNVTDMSNMFKGATSFNIRIWSFDVSSVTNMSGMFEGATSFLFDNHLYRQWDTSNVTDMSNMFKNATSFDFSSQYNLEWDVSSVTNMSSMFEGATSYSNNSITDGYIDGAWGGWRNKVSNVTDMSNMFNGATAFTGRVTNWILNSSTGVPDLTNMIANSGVATKAAQFQVTSPTPLESEFTGNPSGNPITTINDLRIKMTQYVSSPTRIDLQTLQIIFMLVQFQNGTLVKSLLWRVYLMNKVVMIHIILMTLVLIIGMYLKLRTWKDVSVELQM